MVASYRRNQLESATPSEILVMLLQAAVSKAQVAGRLCDESKDTARGTVVRRFLDIIIELRSTLDKEIGGEAAVNLDSLYDYVIHETVEAHRDRDQARFENVRSVMDVIRDAFEQAAAYLCEHPDEFRAAAADAERIRAEGRAANEPANEPAKAEAPPPAKPKQVELSKPIKLVAKGTPSGVLHGYAT